MCIAILMMLICTVAFAQEEKSGMKPEWLSKGEESMNAKRSNDMYYFKIVANTGESLEELRKERTTALANHIEQTNQISGVETTSGKVVDDNGSIMESRNYEFSFTNKSETVVFHAKLVDEYWTRHMENDKNVYEYYALFAVSSKGTEPIFDDFETTTSYGSKALLKSIIPGVGQIYKGSATKGYMIIGGEVACIGGIIFCESQRSSYSKKMKEQPKHASEYNTRADNWANGRNICIGAAAALYVYNLIDAAVCKGARRVNVKKKNTYLSMAPTISTSMAGATLSLNF